MRAVQRELAFEVVAICLLPNHLHCIWTLPPNESDFSIRWKKIKREFTQAWVTAGGLELTVTKSQRRRGNRGVWQRRFYEHQICSDEELEAYCDYIHYNPVRHGLVSRPWDWTYSTFREYVARGSYPWDWGRDFETKIECGEA